VTALASPPTVDVAIGTSANAVKQKRGTALVLDA